LPITRHPKTEKGYTYSYKTSTSLQYSCEYLLFWINYIKSQEKNIQDIDSHNLKYRLSIIGVENSSDYREFCKLSHPDKINNIIINEANLMVNSMKSSLISRDEWFKL